MREQNWCDVIDNVLVIIWCMFIVGGCTYLVFWMNASGWWYLLATLFISTTKTTYVKEMNAYLKDSASAKL
jgi:hypothetical protein